MALQDASLKAHKDLIGQSDLLHRFGQAHRFLIVSSTFLGARLSASLSCDYLCLGNPPQAESRLCHARGRSHAGLLPREVKVSV
jgi:hypothetical protein